ncbi:MAG: hypothetical protein QG671_4274, partial [Actinomycetota bacterium]|nr:hypothetical protein [Actinomycetota bacterium]
MVVEVWRDFGVWPVDPGGPVDVWDRVAALGVAVEVVPGCVGGAAESDAAAAASAEDAAAAVTAKDAAADTDAEASAESADAAAEESDAEAEGPEVLVSGGVWEAQLALVVSRWWLASCPGWVSAQWADVRLSSPVRDLMGLPPGPALLAA